MANNRGIYEEWYIVRRDEYYMIYCYIGDEEKFVISSKNWIDN